MILKFYFNYFYFFLIQNCKFNSRNGEICDYAQYFILRRLSPYANFFQIFQILITWLTEKQVSTRGGLEDAKYIMRFGISFQGLGNIW